MKKYKLRILLPVIVVIILAVLIFTFMWCSSSTSILQVTKNGTYSTDGYDLISVEVPSSYSYNVTMFESESDYSGETLIETIARVRPTVVDVETTLSNGTSAGSGVIIGGEMAADGSGDSSATYDKYYIITNHHVIDDGLSYTVDVLTIDDDSEYTTTYEAKLIGGSPSRDIAVLVIDPPDEAQLSIATFIADSDTVKVGTEVFAIGNPLGILGGTVTKGIVSATKREVIIDEIGTMTLMQTDAAINSGNSGGGLFDTNGNIVGIINSGYSSYNGQSVEGLNFAIPGNDAQYAAEQLIENYKEDGDSNVISYGYIEGDVQLDVIYSTYMLYEEDSPGSSRNYYVCAQASSASSPFYSAWQSGGSSTIKALFSITVDSTYVDLSPSESESTDTLYGKASEAFDSVVVGSSVTVEYKDIRVSGVNYNYLSGDAKELTFIAEQYVYIPNYAAA